MFNNFVNLLRISYVLKLKKYKGLLRPYKYFFKKFGLLEGLKFVLIHIKRKGGIEINSTKLKNPLILRANTSDIPTFEQIFLYEDYNFEINFEPKLIIDGGAYVGYSSVFFASKFPKAKIIAVEPAKSNVHILVKNTKNYDNIVVCNKALWSKKTFLAVRDKGYGEWGFIVEEVDGAHEDNIESTTPHDILMGTGFDAIDILKLDIEGAEKEVFSQNYDNWLGKVKVLIIELHDRILAGCSEVFFRAIKSYKFSCRQRGENLIFIK